jgi:hypothetical protein
MGNAARAEVRDAEYNIALDGGGGGHSGGDDGSSEKLHFDRLLLDWFEELRLVRVRCDFSSCVKM